ncbi:Ger(x)C family spore germination protein [Paenibacillus sp. NPDC058071]|uniref:Ger(x)C family spore germination protein n=1 Tax=Paenibacillus sp. NPDC058071 TaxID=3346326 RepID=UPI0036DA5E33
MGFVSKLSKLIVALTLLVFASGCWDEQNLQQVSYITALGVDYVDGQFEIHAQLIEFGSVAKKESSGSGSGTPLYVGKKTGETPLQAYFNLMNTSQYKLSMDHLKTVVVHERAFSHIRTIIDGLNRMRATRYTANIFGTKDKMENLLDMDVFYNSTPLNSVLYSPEVSNRDNSSIRPYTMQQLVREAFEPGMVSLLPSIKVNDMDWKAKKKSMNLVTLDGVFLFKRDNYIGFLSKSQVSGLVWKTEDFHRSAFTIELEEGKRATIVIQNSDLDTKVRWSGNEPIIELKGNVKVHIIESGKGFSRSKVEKKVEEHIKEEMQKTLANGFRLGADLYQLEHHLYRYHYGKWKTLTKDGPWEPNEKAVSIVVHCEVTHSGEHKSQFQEST